jgi:threonine/homoserine/homoserine lactone efflux protein
LETLWLGVVAGLALAVPMGAMSLLLINTSISRGVRHGVAGGAAMATVDGLYAFLAASFGIWLTGFMAEAAQVVSLAGAAVLLLMAVDLFRKALRPVVQTDGQPQRTGSAIATYFKFGAATMLNPPTAIYFLSLAPLLAKYSSEHPVGTAGLFALAVLVGSLLWQQTLAIGAAWLGTKLTQLWRQRLSVFGAVLILVMALLLAYTAVQS